MAQFPIDSKNDVIDAVNYLLSGPAGLGQNFRGMYLESPLPPALGDTPPWVTCITGNTGNEEIKNAEFTTPATVNRFYDGTWRYPALATLPGLAIQTTAVNIISNEIISVDFTSPVFTNYTPFPFVNGQLVRIQNATPSAYNGLYTVVNYAEPQLGVPSNTVELLARTPTAWPAYTSGAEITINADYTGYQYQNIPTPAQSFAQVDGPQQRVYISGQLDFRLFSYVKFDSILSYNPRAWISINRYRAVAPTTVPDSYQGYQGYHTSTAGTPFLIPSTSTGVKRYYKGYVWEFDKNIISRQYNLSWDLLATEVKVDHTNLQVFINLIDTPVTSTGATAPGYYWYVLEISLDSERDTSPNTGAIILVGLQTSGSLTFSTQVVKE